MLKKLVLTVLVLNLAVLASCSTIEKQQRTVFEADIQADSAIRIQQDNSDTVLRVATLNLAHGRKVLPDTLSDHAMVVSHIRFKGISNK